MPRARNQPYEYVPIAPQFRDISRAILTFDPAIQLLIGPQGTRVLRKVVDGRDVRVAEIIALARALQSGVQRGIDMQERLTGSQVEQINELAACAKLVGQYAVLLQLPEDEALEYLATLRRENPEAEATILLEPDDQEAFVLSERVVGLYQPIFRHEPQVATRREDSKFLVTLRGDQRDVTDLVEIIRLTLGANNYRGTFDAEMETVRVPNVQRRKNALLR